jgi:tol-pal system protein YbgF
VKAARAAAALAVVLTLSGCVATQQDVLGLSEQTDDLKAQIADLKKTVSSLQANQADLSVQINQLHEDLTANSETVKASMGNMDQLSTKLDTLGEQLSGKVTQLGKTLSDAQQKDQQAQMAAIDAAKRETNATELFVASDKRLQARDYSQAAAGFEEYLKRFPSGALTDVATYDLGRAYYGLDRWKDAGVRFATVLEKYPKSGQTPGARLHYALCLLHLGHRDAEAAAYLKSVVADFPRSGEAREAAAELKRLEHARRPAKPAQKPARKKAAKK